MSVLEYFKYLPKGFLNGRFQSLNVALKADVKLTFLALQKLKLAYLKGSDRDFSVCRVSPGMARQVGR